MNLFVETAYAAPSDFDALIVKISENILNPFIAFLFVLATVYFLFGLVQFYIAGDNEESRKKGQSHMVWGIVGMFIMLSVFGIMRVIVNTLGINLGEFGATIP